MSTTVEVLRRVRLRLTPAGAWIKRAAARDGNGNAVGSRDPRATGWCLVGAVEAEIESAEQCRVLLTELSRFLDARFRLLADFNDSPATTQAMVLAIVDRAIASAGA